MIKSIRSILFTMAAVALTMIGAEWSTAPAMLTVAIAPAHAVVGRPATPVSVAGVASRTTRRTVAAETAAAPVAAAAAVTTAAVVGARVAALPPGCTTAMRAGVTYQSCGRAYYRPYYDGPNVVYVVASPP